MDKTDIIYKKVMINDKSDLPEVEGTYFVFKRNTQIMETYPFFKTDIWDWLDKFEAYLCPVNIREESDRIDIKYIDIPNICFSLTDADDDREPKYSKQRKTIGFDDSETWSLRDTIGNFIIPRLERFIVVNNGTPCELTNEEWLTILNKILLAFKLITRDRGTGIFTDEESLSVDEGLHLFSKWYMALWW